MVAVANVTGVTLVGGALLKMRTTTGTTRREPSRKTTRENREKSQGREGYKMVFVQTTNSLLVLYLYELRVCIDAAIRWEFLLVFFVQVLLQDFQGADIT